MATFVVTIPDFLPTTVNVLLRKHWAKRRKTMRAEAGLICHYLREAGVPAAAGRRRVSPAFYAPGGRGAKTGDPDARMKGLLDALVLFGALVDDSAAWCELAAPRCVRGPRRTVITLEDLEP